MIKKRYITVCLHKLPSIVKNFCTTIPVKLSTLALGTKGASSKRLQDIANHSGSEIQISYKRNFYFCPTIEALIRNMFRYLLNALEIIFPLLQFFQFSADLELCVRVLEKLDACILHC